MRVFISSTVFDLIDVRAEVAEQLKSLGITPVLSDDKLSDFVVQPDINSIETCLVNVESCDEVILILDQRYGSTLEKFGYGDISATHLEYRHAAKTKIPIHFYVRDRLEGDFNYWKKGRNADISNLSWVKHEKDLKLFSFFEEHKLLRENATVSNWYSTFTSSIDLKAAIIKRFEKRISSERLIQMMQDNKFPLIDIKVKHDYQQIVEATLVNVSSVPAFNFNVYWEKQKNKNEQRSIFSSTQRTTIVNDTFRTSTPFTEFLIVQYEIPIGVLVHNKYQINCDYKISNHPDKNAGNVELIEQKFYRSSNISIEIEDNV
jgi:hypothetical protein